MTARRWIHFISAVISAIALSPEAWAGAQVVRDKIMARGQAAARSPAAGTAKRAAGWSRVTRRASAGSSRSATEPSPIATVAEEVEQTPTSRAASAPIVKSEPTEPASTVPHLSERRAPAQVGTADPLSDSDTSAFIRGGTGLHLGVRTGLVRRSMDYTQDIYQRMRELRATHYVYRMDAAAYPSFLSPELRGRIGLIARFEHSFAGSVRDADFGGEFGASYSELFGGVRVRHPLRAHALGFDLTFGRLRSGLDDPNGAAGTPDVSYSEGRASIDGTLHVGRIQATLNAGFRVPIGYGELSSEEWFPRVGGYGVDASALVSYELSRKVSVDVSTSLRRFVLEMNSEPEDGAVGVSEIAGGAVDTYVAAYVGVSFVL